MAFSFKNVGHYFAVVGRILIKSAEFAVKIQPQVAAVNNIAIAAEKIAGVPPSVTDLQAASMGAYGHIAKVLDSGKARNPDGSLDLGTIEANVVDAVAATKGVVEAFGASAGIPKPMASPAQQA